MRGSLESGRLSHGSAIHLHPTAPLADRVLLPGDPGRALALAQALLERPLMFNHNRGLWGYTGDAPDGRPLTIQATGMGGPSAAIVLAELALLGARRAIRVGTCGALQPQLALGELVIASEAICADGTSRALGGGERAQADQELTGALARQLPDAPRGAVVSTDLFYETGVVGERETGVAGEYETLSGGGGIGAAARDGALAVEMEAATLFTAGARNRMRVGCLLTVTDVFDARGARTRIAAPALLEAAERMGRAAIAALSEP
jgi:uridine phosphorylase